MIVQNVLSSFSENFRYLVVGDIYTIFKAEDSFKGLIFQISPLVA